MTCPPRAADRDRTVLETTVIEQSGDWWTGVVHDRDPESGEHRNRLERWVENADGYTNPHTWRVRPDFWDEEREAVADFLQHGGRTPPTNLPVNDFLTPLEYFCVRKDNSRLVAVVRLEKPYGKDQVKLYHWNPSDESNRQKWLVQWHWSELEAAATKELLAIA